MSNYKVLAFDPGATTGMCCVTFTKGPTGVSLTREIPLTELSSGVVATILNDQKPDAVVVEDIVATGKLNQDKVAQIKAFDRIMQGARAYDHRKVFVLSPELRKRHNVEVPNTIKGQHARDALRLATAHAIKEGRILLEPEADTEEG